MSKLKELVGIVSFLSGQPRKTVAEAQVDETLSLDLDGEMYPMGKPEDVLDVTAVAPDEKISV